MGVKKGPKRRTDHGIRDTYYYSTRPLSGLEDIVGRAIVSYKKPFRQSYVWGKELSDDLLISEIRPQRMSVLPFPGYHHFVINHERLKTIVQHGEPSWKSALSSMGGVYLIVDRKTGKQYVGSAYGEGGIWQRWCAYVNNGHGGNKELRDLLAKKPTQYTDNFVYSILEVAASTDTKEMVIDRETHWKNALLTREHGYNKN